MTLNISIIILNAIILISYVPLISNEVEKRFSEENITVYYLIRAMASVISLGLVIMIK